MGIIRQIHTSKYYDNLAKSYDWIGGLKGICACTIAFTFHYYCSFQAKPLETWLGIAYEYGQYLVELFFALSGFVITLNYCERIQSGKVNFQTFIFKRMKRLYPAFLISTLVTALLIWVSSICAKVQFLDAYNGGDLYHLFLNIALLGCGWVEDAQTFNMPTWYISILMICYAVFYIVEYHVPKAQKVLCWILIAVFGLWIVHKCPNLEIPLLRYANGRGYLSFSIGVLLCRALTNTSDKKCYMLMGGGND